MTTISEAERALEWALDLLDIYDAELSRRGEDPHKLLSELHIEAKLRARRALAALSGKAAPGNA